MFPFYVPFVRFLKQFKFLMLLYAGKMEICLRFCVGKIDNSFVGVKVGWLVRWISFHIRVLYFWVNSTWTENSDPFRTIHVQYSINVTIITNVYSSYINLYLSYVLHEGFFPTFALFPIIRTKTINPPPKQTTSFILHCAHPQHLTWWRWW